MNSREHSVFLARFDALREELSNVQREREYRPISNGGDGWVLYEQMHMWGVVNRMRSILRHQGPVPFTEIQRVEQMAAGHVDYSKKFALYCAELIENG